MSVLSDVRLMHAVKEKYKTTQVRKCLSVSSSQCTKVCDLISFSCSKHQTKELVLRGNNFAVDVRMCGFVSQVEKEQVH